MVQIWKGKTQYFDEMLDTFMSAGIKCEVDRKEWTIHVPKDKYNEAYGMLMDLNAVLEAGW